MTTSNTKVGHEFVEFIPDNLEPATVYISLKYKTMVHLCPCGCGNKVVTPLSPTGWNVRFDGRTISIYPSIGSWNLPCESHYWITHGQVEWSERWSTRRIKAGFERDQRIKREYYGEIPARKAGRSDAARDDDGEAKAGTTCKPWWDRLKRRP